MSKHINKKSFFNLPSGANVHPCRLIQRDGTLMWKHALLHHNEINLPASLSEEQHIIKTAQRLEELNSWLSHGLEPWECFVIKEWYVPSHLNYVKVFLYTFTTSHTTYPTHTRNYHRTYSLMRHWTYAVIIFTSNAVNSKAAYQRLY